MNPPIEYDLMGASETLEMSFPIGMFDEKGMPGQENAIRALRIIENIIQEASLQNAQHARFALLQSYPRFIGHEGLTKNEAEAVRSTSKDFVRRYCTALAPAWYAEIFSTLDDDEMEVFLKNYLYGHESWGHPRGVATMVQSMLESCLHEQIPVDVHTLAAEERAIPEDLHSKLGRKEHFSCLGRNFMIGKRVQSRPEFYDITIGPVTTTQLETFQRVGWADGTRPTEKLYRLVALAEPFYLYGKLRFLFEKVGFVLGNASVGRSRLGVVGQVLGWAGVISCLL